MSRLRVRVACQQVLMRYEFTLAMPGQCGVCGNKYISPGVLR
jgi:hypothetical protein